MTDENLSANLTLVVRRLIAASPQQLFRAWTDEHEFVRWWGPQGVVCEAARIDLRVGGAYEILNRLPDGGQIWIRGVFEVVEPPSRLVYSWRTEPGSAPEGRVVVSFAAQGDATEVTVIHERNATKQARDGHERGWVGCLEGLADYMAEGRA